MQLRHCCVFEPPQAGALVVQPDPMRESRPRECLDFQDIVQELHQLIGASSDLLDLIGLRDRVEMVAHVVNAAAFRPNDIIEPGEVAYEQGLGISAFPIEAAHQPTAVHSKSDREGKQPRDQDVLAVQASRCRLPGRKRQ